MKVSIHKSPFYNLDISVRDNREDIIDKAESLSLIKDPDECIDMQSQLLNLNSRLKHEIEWLPGVDPFEVRSLLEALQLNSPHIFNKLPILAQANLIISYIELNADVITDEESVSAITLLASLSEKIKAPEVQDIINKDRLLSKFPEIKDSKQIAIELENRKNQYVSSLESFLNTLEPGNLLNIVTLLLERTTNNGSCHAPDLIYKFIDRYNLLTNAVLEQGLTKITNLINIIKGKYKDDGSQISKEISELIKSVYSWDAIAQPSQIASKSQEIEHKESKDLASSIRNLAVHIFNINNLSEIPEQLNQLITEAFKELPQVFLLATEDSVQIKTISASQKKLNKESEELEKENQKNMQYEAEWGILNPQHLEITDKFIMLNDNKLYWDSITGFKLTGIRDQNAAGIATSIVSLGIVNLSEFHIDFSFTTDAKLDPLSVDLFIKAKEDVAQEIHNRLSVLRHRLTQETLSQLEEGKKIKLGDVHYDNNGFYCPAGGLRIFGEHKTKTKYLTWDKILKSKKWNQGVWTLSCSTEKSIQKVFTMGADYNMDIFYNLLNMTWENFQGSITESLKT